MPTGDDPPDPVLTATLVADLRAMGYDSNAEAFKSGTTLHWLFVERINGEPVDRAQWFYATDSEGAENPKFLVPPSTYDVIKNGSYLGGLMIHQGTTYHIRMYREASGKQVAKAIP